MKVYISGAISGIRLEPAKHKFKLAEISLKEQGYEVVNPMEINDDDTLWTECLIKDIQELMYCDAIYMLSDWINSRGARIEFCIAKEMGKKIMFEDQEKDLVYLTSDIGKSLKNIDRCQE